jgi:hypothetical protein
MQLTAFLGASIYINIVFSENFYLVIYTIILLLAFQSISINKGFLDNNKNHSKYKNKRMRSFDLINKTYDSASDSFNFYSGTDQVLAGNIIIKSLVMSLFPLAGMGPAIGLTVHKIGGEFEKYFLLWLCIVGLMFFSWLNSVLISDYFLLKKFETDSSINFKFTNPS